MNESEDFRHEEAVLGACLMSTSAMLLAVDALEPEWFGLERHQKTFRVIAQLMTDGKDVDELTVCNTLGLRGADMTWLMGLTQLVPAVSNTRAYIAEVIQGHRRRTAGKLADTLRRASIGESDLTVDDALNHVEAGIYDLSTLGQGTGGTYDIEAALRQMDYQLPEAEHDTDRGLILPFSHREINAINGGRRPGNVTVSGGYTGDGKTWDILWDMQVAAEEIVRRGDPGRVVMFQLEMDIEEVIARMMAMAPGMTYEGVINGTIPLEQQEKRRAELRALPIDIIDTPLTIGKLRATLAKYKAAGTPVRNFVIDHMGLVDWPGKINELRQTMERGIRDIKTFAKEFRCSADLLVQLNEIESQKDNPYPPPSMRSFRDTRAYGAIADYAKFVWRERNGHMQLETGRIIVAKVRNGKPIKPIPVRLDTNWMRFVTDQRSADYELPAAKQTTLGHVPGFSVQHPTDSVESTNPNGAALGPEVV